MEKNIDLEQRIRKNYIDLSQAQRSIAEFLLSNFEQAAFLTASRLGALVGVSESTVVRFAYALGYQGWPQLQSDLQEMVKDRLSTVTRLRLSASKSNEKKFIAQEVIEADMENLKSALEDLKEETINAAVDAIIEAKDIYVLGLRSAKNLAHFLAFYLQMIGKDVHVIPTGLGSIYEDLTLVSKDHLVIGISFPRYTTETVKSFNFAKNMGAKTIAITDSIISPLGQMADITLTAKSNIGSFMESFVAPLSLINAILTAVGQRDKSRTLACLDNVEKIASNHDIFYLPGGDNDNTIRLM